MRKIKDENLLPRHPRIRSTETILPYILRLAEENGYSTPCGILSHARIQPATLDLSFNLTDIAQTANYAPSELFAHGYHADLADRSARLLGHPVRRQDLSLTWPKLCPECVAEKGYIEAHFDLAVMIACPVHKKRLVNICATCSRKLRWCRPGLLTCECGATISARAPVVEDNATTDLLDMIRRKALRLPPEVAYGSEIPATGLSEMSLRSILFLVAVLGRIQLNRLLAVTSESSEYVVPRAAKFLASWPNNYVQLLEEMTHGHPRGIPLPTKAQPLKGLYQSLRYGFIPKEDGAFIRDRIVNYRMNALDVLNREDEESSADKKSSERFVSVNKFADRYHIDPRTARRMLADEQIPLLSVPRKSSSRNYVDVSVISVVPKVSGKVHRIKVAASLLGMTANVLRSLRASNDFEVNHLPKGMRGVHEGDVNVFSQRLKSRAPASIAKYGVPSSAICLDTIKSSSQYSTTVKVAVVRGILAGIIPVIACRDDSVGGLAVPLDLLRQYAEKDTSARLRRRLGAPKNEPHRIGDCLTTTEAADILGCSPLSIPRLINRGFLEAERTFRGWWIRESSVKRFKQTYTAVKTLADSYHTLPYAIMQFCNRHKIPLIEVFLGGHHGNQAFVKTADVPPLSEYLKTLHVRTIRRRYRRLMLAA